MTTLRSVEKYLKGIHEDDRRCYLRLGALKRTLSERKVLAVLFDELEVPTGKRVRDLDDEDLFEAIGQHVDYLTKTRNSRWFDAKSGEVLAATIYGSPLLRDSYVNQLFSHVKKEAVLFEPVARWLEEQQCDVHEEIPMGKKRVDVLGHRGRTWGGLRGQQVIGVELKNDTKEFERAIDQMTTYADYAHKVYLACTPGLAAEYLMSHAKGRGVTSWDAGAFDRKLKKLGFGLLIVEGTDVYEEIVPRTNEVAAGKMDEIMRSLDRAMARTG